MDRKQIGEFGEKITCYYLKKKGYKILDRNYKKELSSVAKGEIDVVAKPRRNASGILRGRKDDVICFVEVKTIVQPAQGGLGYSPEAKVDFQKQRKIIKLAQNWLADNKIPIESKWQIDVISVKISPDFKKAKVKHFRNIIC